MSPSDKTPNIYDSVASMLPKVLVWNALAEAVLGSAIVIGAVANNADDALQRVHSDYISLTGETMARNTRLTPSHLTETILAGTANSCGDSGPDF